MPYKLTAIITATIVAVLVILLALAVWILSRDHHYNDTIKLPLPHQIGGTVPINVDITAKLHADELALSTALTLQIAADDIANLLPTREFSLLLQDVESEEIASMVGRLAFVPDTVVVQGSNGEISIGTGINGEFYVRERKTFGRDEEQPDAGDLLPYAGSAVLILRGIRLDPSWQLIVEHKLLEIQFDQQTHTAWADRFGSGDYLAKLVEGILNQRANTLLAQIQASSGELRGKIEDLVTVHVQRELKENWGHFQVKWIEVDNCPTVDAQGSVSFALAARARIMEIAEPVLILPDLTVRPGPCTS